MIPASRRGATRRALAATAAVVGAAVVGAAAAVAEPAATAGTRYRHRGAQVEVTLVPRPAGADPDEPAGHDVVLRFTRPGARPRLVPWTSLLGCDDAAAEVEWTVALGDRRLVTAVARCDHGADFLTREVAVALVFVGDRRRRGRLVAQAEGTFANERDACVTIDVPYFRIVGGRLEQVRWREVERVEANRPGADCVAAPRTDTVERRVQRP